MTQNEIRQKIEELETKLESIKDFTSIEYEIIDAELQALHSNLAEHENKKE